MVSLKNIQTEIDASFLYGVLAENEPDENIANVFRQMSEIEHGHALAFLTKNGLKPSELPVPSVRAKIKELSVSIVQGLAITAGMLLLYQYAVSKSYSEDLTRSMVFTGLLSANIFLTLINRSFYESIIRTIQYKNNLVRIIIGTTILLSILIFVIPGIAGFFQLEVPDVKQLLISIGFGLISTVWFECVKFYTRRKAKND